MKITDVTTTVLFYPHTQPIQDATIPPPGLGAGGRGELFVHIHTDEAVAGLGVRLQGPLRGARDGPHQRTAHSAGQG